MAMICTVCGAENMEGSIYCEDCGARLPVAAGAVAAAEAAPITAPPIAPVAPPPVAPPPVPMAEAAEPTREALPPVPSSSDDAAGNVCATCGAVNAPGENYCEDCGAALTETAATPPIPAPQIGDSPPPITAPPSVPSATTEQPIAASPHSGKPRLEAVDTGQAFVLEKDENAVGRRSPVDGIFPEVDLTEADRDSYISRRHGRVFMTEQGPVYEDLGSSNGSFHNGNRLQQGVQAALKDGDRLRLGRTELVFRGS